MLKTQAYDEISTGINPYREMLDSVILLLNRLKEKQAITNDQYKMMIPDKKTCELPHLYFIPKAHKV